MNFFSIFFKPKLKDFFLSFDPSRFDWRVVAWNLNLQDSSSRTYSIELKGEKITSVEWTRSKFSSLRVAKDKGKIFKKLSGNDQSDYARMMNLAIHSTILAGLDELKPLILQPVSGVTAPDFQSESKALEWLKVSFTTLNNALEKIGTDSNLILTAGFFCGLQPDTGEKVLRLLALNLDIFYYFLDDNSLRIVIFNDKDQGHGSAKSPIFHQIIKVTKAQFYDEIIKLINKLAIAGEVE
jgi:hypothetical protein